MAGASHLKPMKANLGLSDSQRGDVVGLLTTLLADEFLLYTKTRNYHWNVVGHQFHDLHKFFEAQYEALDEIVDDVAERARSLGGPSAGTLKEFLGATRLKENPGESPDARGMVANLLADHESIVKSLRVDLETCTKLGDAGTADFLTGLMERHEKTAWMLRATLEGK
jgi:starvation-inducible DNA-binding protein